MRMNEKVIVSSMIIFMFSMPLGSSLCLGDVTNASMPIPFYAGESFRWTIDGFPVGTTIQWWNSSTWTFVANWHANIGDEVTFNVNGNSQIAGNDCLKGTIVIGNLSLLTNDHDIGTNLIFSAYPWVGGLVCLEQNWSSLNDIPPFADGEFTELSLDEKMTILDLEVGAIRITYNDGFQRTELFYEPTTGILLSANTTAGNYWLQIHLIESSIPLPKISSGLPLKSSIGFLIVMTLTGPIITFRKNRKAVIRIEEE